MNQYPQSDEAELSFWRRAVSRHRRLVAGVIVVFVVVTVAAVLLRPPSHTASTEIFVSGSEVTPEVQFVRSQHVLDTVAAELGYSPDATVEADETTWILVVTATAATPEEAVRIADTYAAVYVRLRDAAGGQARRATEVEISRSIARVEQAITDLPANAPAGVTARLESELGSYRDALTSATAAEVQAGPHPVVLSPAIPAPPDPTGVWLYALAAAAVGAVTGIGAAGIATGLDPRISEPGPAVRILRAPLLGTVGRTGPALERTGWNRRAPGAGSGTPSGSEAIGLVRALVLPADRDKVRGSVLVCGADGIDREDASRVATDLARSFARTGVSTALLRADFGMAGSVGDGPHGRPGLTAVLAERATLDEALTPAPGPPGLQMLFPGEPPDSTVDLFSSRGFGRLLEKLESRVDVVVLHCPPIDEDPGAGLVARVADATVAVVSGRTRRDRLTGAEEILRATGGRLEGIVFIGDPGR